MPERKATGKKPTGRAEVLIGVAWYRREDWPKLLAAAADRDALEDTYDEWRQTARQMLLRLSADGRHVKKVDIDLDKLIAWCRNKRLPLDGDARVKYVSEVLAR
jgi:hypothetical protein